MAPVQAQQGARPLELRSETLGRILFLGIDGGCVLASVRTIDRMLPIACTLTAVRDCKLAGSNVFIGSVAFDIEYAESSAIQAWLDSLA